MRILQVNKFLYRRAGAEAYVLDLARLLMAHGHTVGLWGTDQIHSTPSSHPPEPPLGQGGKDQGRKGNRYVSPPLGGGVRGGEQDLLVHYLNFDQREGWWRDLKKFGHMIWSLAAARKFEMVLKQFRPEVIHIHNIYHHLSPSILSVASKRGIPVIMTVHDYHLVNPNYVLYDHGAICARQGFGAIVHRCIKNSYAASLADAVEWQVHRWMQVYEKHVSKFLVPANFVKEKLVDGGMDAGKIEVVPLPVYSSSPSNARSSRLQPRQGEPKGSHYILFAGRITEEKGIYSVLEMAKRLPDMQFKIAGAGPEMTRITQHVSRNTIKNVELLGFLEKEKLQPLIAGARLVFVPSLWYELSPYAVLEAMALGKVVLASRIGGIPELIEHGKTGFLVEPGNVSPWVDIIAKVCYDDALLKKVGKAAQKYIERLHDPEKHYENLMEIYRATGG